MCTQVPVLLGAPIHCANVLFHTLHCNFMCLILRSICLLALLWCRFALAKFPICRRGGDLFNLPLPRWQPVTVILSSTASLEANPLGWVFLTQVVHGFDFFFASSSYLKQHRNTLIKKGGLYAGISVMTMKESNSRLWTLLVVLELLVNYAWQWKEEFFVQQTCIKTFW